MNDKDSSKMFWSCIKEVHRCNMMMVDYFKVITTSRERGKPKKLGYKQLEMTLKHLV